MHELFMAELVSSVPIVDPFGLRLRRVSHHGVQKVVDNRKCYQLSLSKLTTITTTTCFLEYQKVVSIVELNTGSKSCLFLDCFFVLRYIKKIIIGGLQSGLYIHEFEQSWWRFHVNSTKASVA
jgi:hypothetical protein